MSAAPVPICERVFRMWSRILGWPHFRYSSPPSLARCLRYNPKSSHMIGTADTMGKSRLHAPQRRKPLVHLGTACQNLQLEPAAAPHAA